MTGRRSWTKKETEKLREMHADGHLYTNIAKELGRRESSISSKVYALGLSKKRGGAAWTIEEDDRLRSYFDKGLEDDEIAKKMERTTGAVQVRRSQMGLSNNTRKVSKGRKPWTEEDMELLEKYSYEGMTDREIAERLGRTKEAISQRRMLYRINVTRQEGGGIYNELSDNTIEKIERAKSDAGPISNGVRESKNLVDKELRKGKDYLVEARGIGHLKRDERNRKIMTFLYSTDDLFVFEGENYKETYMKWDVVMEQPSIREVTKTDY